MYFERLPYTVTLVDVFVCRDVLLLSLSVSVDRLGRRAVSSGRGRFIRLCRLPFIAAIFTSNEITGYQGFSRPAVVGDECARSHSIPVSRPPWNTLRLLSSCSRYFIKSCTTIRNERERDVSPRTRRWRRTDSSRDRKFSFPSAFWLPTHNIFW